MKRIKHVREHLVQDMEHRTNLKELALEHNLSLTQLKDGFRQIYGESPYAYLRSYKMHRAAQLLRQSDKKNQRNCAGNGLSESKQIFRGIPCVIGCRPSAYRKEKSRRKHSDTFRMEVSFFGFLEHFAEGMAFRSGKRIFHMVICTS